MLLSVFTYLKNYLYVVLWHSFILNQGNFLLMTLLDPLPTLLSQKIVQKPNLLDNPLFYYKSIEYDKHKPQKFFFVLKA